MNRQLGSSSSQPELFKRRMTPRADSKNSKLSVEEKLKERCLPFGGTGNSINLSKMLLNAEAIPEHNPKTLVPG